MNNIPQMSRVVGKTAAKRVKSAQLCATPSCTNRMLESMEEMGLFSSDRALENYLFDRPSRWLHYSVD